MSKGFMFFLSGLFMGLSAFMFYVQGSYTIQANINNAVQVIKKIVLVKNNNTTTGLVLEGENSKIYLDEICNLSGTDCKNTTMIINYQGLKVPSNNSVCNSNTEYGIVKFSGDNFFGCNSSGRVRIDN